MFQENTQKPGKGSRLGQQSNRGEVKLEKKNMLTDILQSVKRNYIKLLIKLYTTLKGTLHHFITFLSSVMTSIKNHFSLPAVEQLHVTTGGNFRVMETTASLLHIPQLMSPGTVSNDKSSLFQ